MMHSVSTYAPASPNVHSQDTVSNQALVMINTVVWTGGAFWFPDPIWYIVQKVTVHKKLNYEGLV